MTVGGCLIKTVSLIYLTFLVLHGKATLIQLGTIWSLMKSVHREPTDRLCSHRIDANGFQVIQSGLKTTRGPSDVQSYQRFSYFSDKYLRNLSISDCLEIPQPLKDLSGIPSSGFFLPSLMRNEFMCVRRIVKFTGCD